MNRFPVLALVATLAAVSCLRGTGPVAPAPQHVTVEGADGFGAKTLHFSSLPSSETLPIQVKGEWHVYLPSDADWITVSPTSGESDGPVNLTLTVTENTAFAERKTRLSFVSEGIEQKALVTLIQNKRYYIEATVPKSVVNKNGGVFDIAVVSNEKWTYTLDEEGKTWLRETTREDARLVLAAAATTNPENHGTVTFISDADPAIRTSLELWQKDLDLSIRGKELTAAQEGLEITIPVHKVNLSTWKVVDAPAWITAGTDGADGLTLRIAENKSGALRQGAVTIGSDEDNEIRASLPIRQLGTPTPVADLADIVFHEDGSAEDRAEGLTVTLLPGDVSVAYNETFGAYAPVFTHKLGATVATGFYEFPMSSDFTAKLNDGCAIEAIVKLGVPVTGTSAKPFSAHRSSGIGFALSSSNYNDQLLFFLGQRQSGTYINNYAYSGITPEAGVYYHMIGVWDAALGLETIYIDSKPLATNAFTGDLYFSCKHFLIGGAPNDVNAAKAAAAWNGEVLFPRVYSEPLTGEQVEAAFLATRKGHYILVNE